MGRHGTGGSEDAHERGDTSAFWGPDNEQPDSFWSKPERRPEPPGWPSLPDQPEVTGQWAPMPKRDSDPAPDAFQSDPFETTGAFAAPLRPGDDPARPGQDRPSQDQPFETTGAFVRPPSWDEAPEATQAMGPLSRDDPFGQRPTDRPSTFDDHPGESRGRGDGNTAVHDPFGPAGEARPAPPASSGLPAPGDVKVYGEPTAVNPRTPAWAEAETGFLGTGGGGEERDEPEPPRRGRRKAAKGTGEPEEAPSGGRGRLALLSVAAVAVVLGGTVAGVKMVSSGEAADCAGGNCAAVQASGQPSGQGSRPAPEELPADETEEPIEEPAEEPEEEPAEEERTQPAPVPTQAGHRPAPRRTTAAPAPRPSKTRSKEPREPAAEPVEEIPQRAASGEPTEDTTPLDETNGTVPTHGSTIEPDATASAVPRARPVMGGGSVNVRFSVARQRGSGYTATMSVTNSSARPLRAPTLSVPVRGRVLDVDGAEWTQDGNLLILNLSEPIATGATTGVTVSASGKPGEPRSCGLVGGECAID